MVVLRAVGLCLSMCVVTARLAGAQPPPIADAPHGVEEGAAGDEGEEGAAGDEVEEGAAGDEADEIALTLRPERALRRLAHRVASIYERRTGLLASVGAGFTVGSVLLRWAY